MVSTSHSHSVIRRIHRVGACPVLEVAVTYPILSAGELSSGELSSGEISLEELSLGEGGEALPLTRFNEAYRAMAEAWLAWVESTLLPQVKEDFAAAGSGAVYGFDRRVAVCEMRVEAFPPEGGTLTVVRTLRLASRRGSVKEVCRRETDEWRWPELTLAVAANHTTDRGAHT